MRCPSCNADNRAGRRFCGACAVPLPAECAACGFVNQPDDRFCGGCGAPLADAAPAAPPARPAPRQGERRLVTVLFADLAGYTRLTSQLDPEETQALLARFFETVDGVVLAYGGTIDKHIGDNVMGIFGAPIAHDNDPERAVRAAVEIHRRVDELSTELPVPLRVHIGIASGEVVASELGSRHHQEYTVTGDAVNLAARLQDKATAGETMTSDPVRRATEKVAVFEEVGELPIKGLAAPVAVWKVVSLREERAAPRERGFVGRRSELRQLESVLAESLDGGRGAVIQVRGEAGIGKTRFVAEVCDRATALGYACHWALVLDFGAGGGHGALRAAAEKLLGLPASAAEPVRRQAVAGAVAAGQVAADQAVFLADLLGLAPAEAERALYAAMSSQVREQGRGQVLAALLRVTAAARPTLLVIEDIHWADAASLRQLGEVASAASSCPAVLLMTSRLEGDPIDRAWRAESYGGPLLTIDLAPLRTEEALALAAEVYDPGDTLVRTCIERSGGNPLFLEQLLENARESATDGLPATIQSLVLSRMDRLAAADKQALQAAAVIGQQFTVDEVRALTRGAGGCEQLVAHHLVRPVNDGGFLFHHALIRDGVYSSLTRTRRAELHRAAAGFYGEREPTLRAEHLDRAEAPEAPAAYLEAARAEQAALRLERALALAARGGALARSRAEIHALACLEADIALNVGAGAVVVAAARRAADSAPDDAARCRAWIAVAAGNRLQGAFPPAFAVLDQAEPLARALDLPSELALIHYHRGSLLFACGDAPGSRAEQERALAEARRAGNRELEARAISGLADVGWHAGDMQRAAELFAHCLEMCEELGMERFAVPNRLMLGIIDLWFGPCHQALERIEVALEVADRLGDGYAALFGRMQIGMVERMRGNLDRAVAMFRRSRDDCERLGANRFLAEAESFLAEALHLVGQSEAALAAAERSVQLARAHGSGFCGPMCLGVLAALTPDPDVQRAAIAEAEELMARGTMLINRATFHRLVLGGALERGDWDLAEQHAAALTHVVAGQRETVFGTFAARGHLLVAWGRGRRDPDLAAATRAYLAQAERMGVSPRLPPELIALAAG